MKNNNVRQSTINQNGWSAFAVKDRTSPHRGDGFNQNTIADMCVDDEGVMEEVQNAVADILEAKGRVDDADYDELADVAREAAQAVLNDVLNYIDFDKVARHLAAYTIDRVG